MCHANSFRSESRKLTPLLYLEIVFSYVTLSLYLLFPKGAQYFKMKIVKVPVDEEKRTVNIKTMRKAITRNTVMVNRHNYEYTEQRMG